MGADRRHHSADLPAAGDGARLRPGVVRHPRRGVLADGVAVATGGAVRLFPERSGARLGSERYLYRHASVHGPAIVRRRPADRVPADRSEEHTSELQSLMRISYAVFCLQKKKTKQPKIQ